MVYLSSFEISVHLSFVHYAFDDFLPLVLVLSLVMPKVLKYGSFADWTGIILVLKDPDTG